MAIIQSSNFKAGTKVTVYLLKADGSLDGSVAPIEVTVFANGNLVRNIPFDNGENFLLVGTDKQGLAYSTHFTVTDTTRPDKPIFLAQDDVGAVQGEIKTNTTTDDNHPTFSGTSKEIGGVIKIFDQGVEIGSATVKPDGTWSFTPTTPLVDGNHVITIQQIDPKGNISALSDPLTFVVDTQPVKVEILKALDDVGISQGDLANHAITDDTKPTLVGTGLANAVVHISENGTEIGSTTVDASGNWIFELPAQIDGTHQYTATITNTAGVSGSTQFTLTIDTVASMATVTLTGITDDSGIVGDYITNDNTLLISGRILNTLAANDTVQVSLDGGVTWVNAVVDPVTHTWSLDNTNNPLVDGSYDVQARVVDVVGNIGTVSSQTVVIDTQASSVVSTLTGITEDTGVVGDFSTNDNSLVLTGSLSAPLVAGEKVQMSLNGGKTWLEATVDPVTNTWSYDNTDNPLADGTYKFQTRVIDQAGNVGQVTTQDIIIDTRAPLTSAVFTGITEDTGTTGDYITNDNALVFKGKINGGALAAGDTVQLSLDGGVTWVDAVVDPVTRTWSYDNTVNPLADGTHTLIARVVDKAGNPGFENTQDIQIDTVVPTASSSLTSITTDTGVLGDYVTSDNSLIFKGKVDGVLAIDERVQISLDGGTTWLETSLDRATNTWNYNNTINELSDDHYTVQSRVIDTAGNVSGVSTQTVIVDTSISTATATLTAISDDTGTSGDFITQDGTLLFQGNVTGTLASDENIQISLDGGRNWTEVTLDRVANTWRFDHTNTALAEGTYNVQVRVIDTANNVGQLTSQNVVINSQPSAATVEFTGITEDSGVVGDYITNDNTLVLHGKVLNNLATTDHVEISLDHGATWQEAVVDRTNHIWSYDNTANQLVDGDYTFQARVVNVAGVVGPVSSINVEIDTQVPDPSTLAKLTTITDDTGAIGDLVTSDNTLLLNGEIIGQLDATDKVLISLNGGKTWSEATVDHVNKTWSFDNTDNALADGTYKVQVRVDDLAGNHGQISEHDVVIDSRPPVASVLFSNITEDTGVVGDFETKDNTLVFNGTVIGDVAVNDAVEVSLDGGTTWIKAVLDPVAKTWALDYTATTLVDGTYALAARVVDQAGNTGSISTQKLVIDTSVPTATSEFTSITEDTGTAGDYQTNDQTLMISGKVTGVLATGDQVQLSLDGGQTWLNVTVDSATNTWTYNNTANALAEGTYQFQTRVVDKALNGDVTDTKQVVIDLTPPPASLALAFTGISDDTGIAGDYKTSDTTLTIHGKIVSGTLTANDHVEVSVDGGNTWTTVQVDPVSNTWSLDNTANTLSSGSHQLIARVVDQVGNIGHQVIQDVIIATEPPKATADLALITDDSGVAGDFVTNDPSLVFSGNVTGTLDPDETVQVSLDGGLSWLTATIDPTGTHWNLDHAATDLVDGKYTVVTRVIDSTGTAGTENSKEITIDTITPTATTTLSSISQDSAQVGDFITNDNTLIFNGTVVGNLAVDERVQISLDGGVTWTDATLDRPANMWILDNTAATLADGTYTVVSRVIDQAGNIGVSSIPQNVIVDTALPSSLASITSISEDTGVNASDFITKDPTLIIHGKASTALASNEKIQVSFDHGANWVDATTKADGTWSYDHTAQTLLDGTYTVQARVIDTAGNSSAVATQNFTVDTQVPTALSDLDLKDDIGAIKGTIPQQGVTDDTRPEFTGKAPADAAYVNIYDNGNLIGTATVQADGTWSFTPTLPLGAGPHSLTAAPVDVAGNEGAVTTPWTFDVLGAPPPAPAITNVVDNVAGGLFNQTIPKDGLTNDKTPTISGTGQVGSTIHVYSEGVEVGSTVVKTDGTWAVEVADLGVDGSKAIKAQAVDAAGQLSPFTGDYVIHLDTLAPSKPDLAATDNVGQVVGAITNGSVTDDGTPTFSGKGEAGSTITLTDHGTVIGTTTVQPDGSWTFTPTVELADGPHNVTVTQTDPAGNVSVSSDALTFDIDKSAVQITIYATDNKAPVIGSIADGGVTNDDTPVLSGTTKAGAIVTITDKSGNALGSVTADGTGNWSLEISTQGNGAQTYTATAKLTNGNTATATIGFTIDTVKPVGLTIDTVTDDVGLLQGSLTSGNHSDDVTPTLAGKAEANSIVSIYENGLLVGSATTKADGTWSYTIPAPGLTEGVHALTATQTDQAGNVSDPTGAFNIVIDVTAPVSTAVITAISEDRGTAGDFITNDKTLVINGQVNGVLEAGDKVQMSLDGGVTWKDAVSNANGTWTFDHTANPLADGTYKFESRVIDAAGIPGVATSQNVTIDSILAPSAAINLTGYEDKGVSSTDFYSNDTQFTLNVVGEAGAQVIYQTLVDGTWKNLHTSKIDTDNTSSYDVDWSVQQINDQSRKFRAVITDVAGNSATVYVGGADETAAQNYRVDNVAATGQFTGSKSTSIQGGSDIHNAALEFSETGARYFKVYEQEYRGQHNDGLTELTTGAGLQSDANGKLDLSTLLTHIDNFKNYVFETVDNAGNLSISSQFIQDISTPLTEFYGQASYVNWYYQPYSYLREFSASAFMEMDGIKFYNDSGNLAGFATRYEGGGYVGEAQVYLTLGNGTVLKTTVESSKGYWEFSYNGSNPIPAGEIAGLRLVPVGQQDLTQHETANYRYDVSVDQIIAEGESAYPPTLSGGTGSYNFLNSPVQYIKGQADTAGNEDWRDSLVSQEYTSTRDNDAIYSNGVATTLVYKVLDTITTIMNSGGAYLGETGTTIGLNGYGSQFDLGTFGNSNLHGWIDRDGNDFISVGNVDLVDINGDGVYDGSSGDTATQVTDLWNHFDETKDKLDISDWITQIEQETGITITDSNIGQYLAAEYVTNAETNAVSTVLSIDRDGAGTNYASSQFLILEATNNKLELADLLNNNIILH